MKLKKRIAKDFRDVQTAANNLFAYSSYEIGKKIELANKDCIGTIAAALSTLPEKITYSDIIQNNFIDRLKAVLNKRYENLAYEIEDYWSEKRKEFDILSRVASSFISTKASPPWEKSVINLKDDLSTEGLYDPRKGHLRLYFRKMVDAVGQQIQQGSLNEETITQILKRVRNMFDRNEKRGVRESVLDFEVEDTSDYDSNEFRTTAYGAVDVSEGTYTHEDIAALKDDMRRANRWMHRQHRPWFTDEIKRNNRYLRDLEQLLMTDALNQLHAGMLQIGSEEMGIEDMEWVASRGPTTCQACKDRDGLTWREILKKFDDTPPPLHPHCDCSLVPRLRDDWADKELEKAGISWDPENGKVYTADDQEEEAGMSDMTFDEYLDSIPEP